MPHRIEHIGIMVSDMERSVRFYTEVLGMQLKGGVRISSGVKFNYLSYPGSDDIQLELISNWREDLPARGNVDHIAINVTDIEQEIGRLKSLGIEMIDRDPRVAGINGGIKIAFFYGPDRERFELYQHL